ncbi:enamine deaminase RidA (YjgF/YER057c/UK114 family) [Neorhizobium galegae]|uniref:RidA family protein n=1 Tax=Neorhizobium galegae TaxID=399 RepID=UPI002780D523|nr:RidA family protein [Neorhizobium galegae]MDQ0138091.1 enamine deaminase RidA (YjgF/YER057c/UK114 family) [Neorhizobium galegae]
MINNELEPLERLHALGITLPPARKPIANFSAAKLCGDLLYISGQGPVTAEGHRFTGKVGGDVSVEEAYDHAKLTGVNLLAAANAALGSLSAIREVVKILGFVNAVPDFKEHPQVINGCSDLMISVFGELKGTHARSAIGVASLPNQITVEVEMIVRVAHDVAIKMASET